MLKGLLKFADSLAAFVILGPALAAMVSTLHAADGDPASTPLTSSTPARGAILLLLSFLAASALGLVSGRVFSRGRGIWIAGLTLFWVSLATATVRQVLGDADGPAALTPLILEAVVLIPLAGLFAVLVEALSPISGEERGHPHQPSLPALGFGAVRSIFEPRSFLPSLVAAIVAAGIVGWLAAITPYKGQALFAAFLGGIAAGFAPGFAASHGHHERPPSLVPAVLALPVVAVISLVIVKFTAGNTGLLAQVRAIASESPGQLFALGRIMPLDWLAGGMIGVPVGANWAASMMDRHGHGAEGHAKPA